MSPHISVHTHPLARPIPALPSLPTLILDANGSTPPSRPPQFDFLQEGLPQLAMFEKIELLHRLYPTYLLGARMAAWLFYEDTDAHNFVMLQHLHWKVDRLRERLELIATTHGTGGPLSKPPPLLAPAAHPVAGGVVLPEHWQALASARIGAVNKLASESAAAAGVTTDPSHGGGAEAAALPGGGPPPAAAAKPAAAAGGGGGRSLGGLVWFFGVYFFFQWLLGRSS